MAPLHPQARAVLDAIAASGIDGSKSPDIAELRRLQEVEARFSGSPQAVAAVRDESIDGPSGALRIRMYLPRAETPRLALLFVHGGGWALGSVELSDHVCRALCNASGAAVASVDYRLAPEHPFPAALDDAFTALQWLRARQDVERVAVCGESAGGNLAAALALLARDRGIDDLALQVLIYPALDPALHETSFATLATGYGLTRDDMRFFWDAYLLDSRDATNPYAAPITVANLSGVAPAYVLTAEYDPLVDEGERYARRIEEAGVNVELRRFEGMIHGFVSYLGAVDAAHEAIDACGRALRNAMATQLPAHDGER